MMGVGEVKYNIHVHLVPLLLERSCALTDPHPLQLNKQKAFNVLLVYITVNLAFASTHVSNGKNQVIFPCGINITVRKMPLPLPQFY